MKNENEPQNNEHWDKAKLIANALRPLLAYDRVPEKLKFDLCRELSISESKFYRELKKLRDKPVASTLLPKKRGPDAGDYLLSKKVEKLISEQVRKHYLNGQKLNVSAFHKIIIAAFVEQSLSPVPSYSTIRRRILDIPKRKRNKTREGASADRTKNSSASTHYIATRPMEIVQIDHTVADIHLIDSVDGEMIGRPIITVAIDIYTRMIVGIYIDFIGPSTESVAEVLVSTCFSKKNFLLNTAIDGSWPCLGLPENIHMDNGADFRSAAVQRGCAEHGINTIYRPLGRPHFGGHVERFIGTLMQKVHTLPGTTFSNIQQKGNYRSEEKAVLTLGDFTQFIVNYIVNTYHKTKHSSLGTSPEHKLEQAAENGFAPRLPAVSEQQFRVNFLNRVERKVRRDGITFDSIQYWSEAIQAWYDTDVSHIWVVPLEKDVSRLLAIGPKGQIELIHSKDYRIPRITRGEYKRYRRRISERQSPFSLTHSQIAQQVKIEHEIVARAKKTRRLRRLQEVRSHFQADELYPTSNKGRVDTRTKTTSDQLIQFKPMENHGEELIEFLPNLTNKKGLSND